MDTIERKTTLWLNSLSHEDCVAAHSILVTQDYYNPPVGTSLEEMAEWTCLDDDNIWADGQFWSDWLRCACMGTTGYPRFQVKLTTGRSEANSQSAKLERRLSPQGWEGFKRLALTTEGHQPKIPAHHLALRAKEGESVPMDTGRGSSISHLCDNKTCIQPSHMEVAVKHASNLDRQRCPGVTILEYGQRVVQVRTCPHGHGSTHKSRIENSCRKINVVSLDPRVADRMKSVNS